MEGREEIELNRYDVSLKNHDDESNDEGLDELKDHDIDEVLHDHIEENLNEDIEDGIFRELEGLIGEEILIVTEAAQLNLLGQTFRPIFIGPVVEVEQGHLSIFPATIKILNAPFYQFPTPISIPLEKIAHFTPNFDSDTRFPLV
jgi:hypothetical protein